MKTIFKYNLKDYLPTKAIPAWTVAGGHKTNAGELTLVINSTGWHGLTDFGLF